jgi:hypothetical protein
MPRTEAATATTAATARDRTPDRRTRGVDGDAKPLWVSVDVILTCYVAWTRSAASLHELIARWTETQRHRRTFGHAQQHVVVHRHVVDLLLPQQVHFSLGMAFPNELKPRLCFGRPEALSRQRYQVF